MAILSLLVLSLLCAASAAAKRKALRRLARWLVESTGSYERLPMLLYGVPLPSTAIAWCLLVPYSR